LKGKEKGEKRKGGKKGRNAVAASFLSLLFAKKRAQTGREGEKREKKKKGNDDMARQSGDRLGDAIALLSLFLTSSGGGDGQGTGKGGGKKEGKKKGM